MSGLNDCSTSPSVVFLTIRHVHTPYSHSEEVKIVSTGKPCRQLHTRCVVSAAKQKFPIPGPAQRVDTSTHSQPREIILLLWRMNINM